MWKHIFMVFTALMVTGGSAEAREAIFASLETAILSPNRDPGVGAVFRASSSTESIPVGTSFGAQYLADERSQRMTFCVKSLIRPSELTIHAPSGGCLGHVVARDGTLGLPATREGDALAVDHGAEAVIVIDR